VGVEKDEKLAAHWIHEAADAGCPAAIAALGDLYANGVGVPRDEQKAVELIQRAAKKKDDSLLCARFGKRTN
jgi:TPR repeat protein